MKCVCLPILLSLLFIPTDLLSGASLGSRLDLVEDLGGNLNPDRTYSTKNGLESSAAELCEVNGKGVCYLAQVEDGKIFIYYPMGHYKWLEIEDMAVSMSNDEISVETFAITESQYSKVRSNLNAQYGLDSAEVYVYTPQRVESAKHGDDNEPPDWDETNAIQCAGGFFICGRSLAGTNRPPLSIALTGCLITGHICASAVKDFDKWWNDHKEFKRKEKEKADKEKAEEEKLSPPPKADSTPEHGDTGYEPPSIPPDSSFEPGHGGPGGTECVTYPTRSEVEPGKFTTWYVTDCSSTA